VDGLLTIKQVADNTGLKESWWRARIRGEQVGHYRLGGMILLKQEDVDSVISACRVEPKVDITKKKERKPRTTKKGETK
jgi:hypothetical protein